VGTEERKNPQFLEHKEKTENRNPLLQVNEITVLKWASVYIEDVLCMLVSVCKGSCDSTEPLLMQQLTRAAQRT
jgi:hypothetical protein